MAVSLFGGVNGDRFHFDEVDHLYILNGEVLPSVTELVRPIMWDMTRVPDRILETARRRGKRGHRMLEQYTAGQREPPADKEMAVRWQGWAQFCDSWGFEPLWAETPTYHPTLLYGGTPDVVGRVWQPPRADIRPGVLAVVDAKLTWKMAPETAVQVAGYQLMLNAHRAEAEQVELRIGVRLDKDGRPHPELYEDEEHVQLFMALLHIAKWKERKHGKTKRRQ